MAEQPRHVNAKLFWVEYAHLDWPRIFQPTQRPDASGAVPTIHNPNALDLHQVGLRWHVNAAEHTTGSNDPIGLPTGPFTVWRRDPRGTNKLEEPLNFQVLGGLFMGMRLVLFDRTVASLTMEVSSGVGGLVIGLANAPQALSVLTWDSVPGGNQVVRLAAGRVNGLLIPAAMTIVQIQGSDPNRVANELEWEPIEIVGMPVDGSWGGIGNHMTGQGIVGTLVDPKDAAFDRISRGTPPFGWHMNVEPGVLAPQWLPVDPSGAIDEVSVDMLPALHDALQLPQRDQVQHRFKRPMPPPETLQGDAMNATANDAQIPTVAMLQLAESGDPFMSLALGYGTNLPDPGVGGTVGAAKIPVGARFDYMVTAPYETGIGTDSNPIELASLALRPRPVFLPPVAANITSEKRAHLPPQSTDTNWRASTTTRWDRAFEMALVRTASHVVTRHAPGAAQADALVEKRHTQGHHPIAPAVADGAQQPNFIHYADRQLEIPNSPGHRTVRYSVANQNPFGVWSPWRTTGVTVNQPQLAPPKILAADFDVVAPSSGTECPASLTVDITWDWTDRRPEQLRLVGRMFAAADRSTESPNQLPPPGLEREIATAGAAVELNFTGDSATLVGAAPGSEILYLDPQGDAEVAPGAAQGDGARRYRVHIAGLVADFASTDHIGMALWTAGSERITPNRVAATTDPFNAYTSDPIAPAVPPELVPLSSLPDAEGRSHARISWPSAPGATAYVVYSSDEITMRANYGLGEPDLNDTLSDRVTELLDAWEDDPDRRPFSRHIPRPVTGTSVDVSLERGTSGITTFVIVSMSAGQVEGPWPDPASPTLRDQVIVRATPRVASPSTPEIEARVDGNDVHLTVRTRPGHRADRVAIHRVRVDAAARELDTMGPAITTVTSSSPGWVVETDTDGTPLSFEGTDTPGSSWRRVWYRAVAWADEEWLVSGQPFPEALAERGLIPGRSPGSNAVSVVVPPPNPPQLSPVQIIWPGGSLAHVQLNWSTSAPFTAPLGAHRLEVDVREKGSVSSLVMVSSNLADIATSAPLSGHGVWHDAGSTPARFHALIRRPDASIELDAVVRVIDPLGRASQQQIHVGGGSVLPDPNLGDLEIFTILGRGKILTFTSDSPITPVAGEAYELRVIATQSTPTPRPPFPPFPTIPRPPVGPSRPPIRPGPLTRVSRTGDRENPRITIEPTEPERIGGELVRPRPNVGSIGGVIRPGRPLELSTALPDIPVDRGQSSTTDKLQVRRGRGAGPSYTYSVLAPANVTRFVLRLTSPDGRIATETIKDN